MVVGSTDSHSARSSRPALTTLDLHPAQIGDAAVRLLVDVVEDRVADPGSITVPTRMHPRASTRRVRDDRGDASGGGRG
jgi:DNA-binding LacI/PurR family transcriptional regulator